MAGNVDNSNQAPAGLSQLSEAQAERLSTVLDEYLTSLERGDAPSLESLLDQHADIGHQLKLYLGKLGDLHSIAAGFSPHLADVAATDIQSLDQSRLAAEETHACRSSTTRYNTTQVGPLVKPEAQSEASPSPSISTRVLQGELSETEEHHHGRRLDDFQLIRVIGRGGMGIVYEAEQISLKRRVALKLLPLISVLDSRQIARFKNEAQAAASLQHPNIVPVFAVGNQRGVHYYAMQLIDGCALDAIIAAMREPITTTTTKLATEEVDGLAQSQRRAIVEGQWTAPLAYQRVLRLGIQAAQALAAAHEEGIVHRDIKPSNLMVDKQHKLWITDFGLARRLSDHSMTATGDVVGTLRYMSPEQARGQAALVDGRTDVYSLGATLYELLTLRPAIAGDNSPELLRAIDTQVPIPLRVLRADVPRDLSTVLEKAMAKQREDRYLTAQAFADDLQRVLQGRPALAKPTSNVVRIVKWIQRNRRLARLSASIALVTMIFVLAGLWIVVSSRMESASFRREANEQARVLENFRQQVLLFEREAAHIPRTDRLRSKMIEHLLRIYQEFVDLHRQHATATTELTKALIEMGELKRKINQLPAAEQLLTEAQNAAQQLVISQPRALLPRRQLAQATEQLAQVAYARNQLPRAQELFSDAVRLQSELSEQFTPGTESNSVLIDLAQYSNSWALLQIKLGHNHHARRVLEDLRTKMEQVLQRDNLAIEERRQLQQLLSAAYTNLAHVIRPSDLPQAIAYYRRALDLNLEVSKQANRLEFDLDLSGNYNNLGTALSESGQLAQAIEQYAAAIKISRLLVNLDPEKVLFASELATGLNNLGMAKLKLSQDKQHAMDMVNLRTQAVQHLQEAIGIQSLLVQADAEDASLPHELGGMFHNLASAQEAAGVQEQVPIAYQAAITHQRRALEMSPEVTGYRSYLDTHHSMYWKWLLTHGSQAEALELIEQQRQLWPANSPQQLELARQLAQAILDLSRSSDRQRLEPLTAKVRQIISLAQEAGLGVQSMLSEEPFLSLIKLKWLTQ